MARILAVDDDPAIRRALLRTLEREGHAVIAAATAAEARAALDAGAFDVAMVDYQLPDEEDGIALLRHILQAQPSCLRILVTGHLTLPRAVAAVNEGEIHRLLRKPFRREELIAAIDEALDRRNRVRASLPEPTADLAPERRRVDATLAAPGFRLALQPIVDVADDAAIGWEALMRPGHPDFATPLALIAAAERTHRVLAMGEAVVREAAAWFDRLPAPGRVFVNLHPDELADPEGLLRRLAPLVPWRSRVVLEITGAALDRWPASLRHKARRLREHGFELALDRLGAARHSLGLLAETNPDFIKVDMDIVRGVDSHPRRRRLLELLQHFAQATGATLIAEGVETEGERRALAASGVRLMQGFLLGPPDFDPGPRPVKAPPRPGIAAPPA